MNRRILDRAAILVALATATLVAVAATPAAAMSARGALPSPYSGEISAGTYALDGLGTPARVTVDDGWTYVGDFALVDEPVFVSFWTPDLVATDACGWDGSFVEFAPDAGAADVVDALTSQESTAASEPAEVTVNGYPAWEFDLAVDEGVSVAECDQEVLCLYSDNPLECGRYYATADEFERVRVIDVRGTFVVMTFGAFEPVDDEQLARARAVFDSITFRPATSGPVASTWFHRAV